MNDPRLLNIPSLKDLDNFVKEQKTNTIIVDNLKFVNILTINL